MPIMCGKAFTYGYLHGLKGEGRVWQKTGPPIHQRYGMQGTGWEARDHDEWRPVDENEMRLELGL